MNGLWLMVALVWALFLGVAARGDGAVLATCPAAAVTDTGAVGDAERTGREFT